MLAVWGFAAHAFCPGASTLGGRHLTTTRQHVLAVASTLPDEDERVVVAESSLETEDPGMATPPPRGIDVGGYVCPPEKCTWEPFQYAPPSVRRATVKHFVDDLRKMPTLPPMKIWLIGGPSAGKGTIAPMLSQAFRVRTIGVGALLRAELRVGTPRARAAAAVMARGELLPDTLALEVLLGLGRLTSPKPSPSLHPHPHPRPHPNSRCCWAG